jgi:hypothetical protein
MDLFTAAQPLTEAFPGDIWLVHALIKKPNGKLDKPPLPGFRSNDKTTWIGIADAIELMQRQPDGSAGISYAIADGMISIDFDDCVATDGTVASEVAAWIERLDSFGYLTVSERGRRVVCRNNAANPIAAGKYSGRLPSGHKVEVFVGP